MNGNAAPAAAGAAAATPADDVDSSPVEADVEPAEEEDDFEPAGEGNTAKTTTDVKFRAEPDADNGDDNVIDELDEGTEVTILGQEGDFYEVQVGDQTGYIHSDYVE